MNETLCDFLSNKETIKFNMFSSYMVSYTIVFCLLLWPPIILITSQTQPILYFYTQEKTSFLSWFPPFFFMNNNFQQWKYDMFVALKTKGEECFVLDNLPCLPSPVSWQRCNKMVIYWFTHFVPPLSSNLYVDGTRFWYIVRSSSTILPRQ